MESREERGVDHQLIREPVEKMNLRTGFWEDVARKVNGEGVTRSNSNKILATLLQVFDGHLP